MTVFHLSWSLNVLLLRVLPWRIHTNGQYRWRVIWEKKIFSAVHPSYNKHWRDHRILFNIKRAQKLRFSQFCIFFLYCVCFLTDPNRLLLCNFYLSLLLFMVAMLQRLIKSSRIKYLVTPSNMNFEF